MGFAKLWDNILDNPKVRCLPLEAFQGWVLLLAVASKIGLPKGQLPRIDEIAFYLRVGTKNAAMLMESLIELGLVDVRDGMYFLHDFDFWNGSKDAKSAARQAAYRARKASQLASRNSVTKHNKQA
jgi:hypothetical protein